LRTLQAELARKDQHKKKLRQIYINRQISKFESLSKNPGRVSLLKQLKAELSELLPNPMLDQTPPSPTPMIQPTHPNSPDMPPTSSGRAGQPGR